MYPPIHDVVKMIRTDTDQRPWLVLGKGPSFNERISVDLDEFRCLTLNHTCLHVSAYLAHFTDMEAYLECAATLLPNEARVVLPWHPHVSMSPSLRNLVSFCERYPSLAGIARKGRLFSYNSDRARHDPHPSLETIHVRLFSAVAAINILASVGVKRIYTLGIDGGTGYASCFSKKDRLANGQPSFDGQMKEIKRTCKHYKVAVVKLTR